MWETVGAIMLKYWVEFLLGLIVTGGGFLLKHHLKLVKAERLREQKELILTMQEDNRKQIQEIMEDCVGIEDEIEERCRQAYSDFTDALIKDRESSKTEDEKLEHYIDAVQAEVGVLKAGLLSVQGKQFKDNCRTLLDSNHKISLDEWEEIDADHDAYNGLGGNHTGDHLYELVKKKAEKQLSE
jgi:hypothetical protein